METTFNKRLFVAWSVLVGITLTYLGIDGSAGHSGLPRASTVVTVVAVCLALFKVRLIMREFMEVRQAPLILSRLTDLLVVVMAAALLATYAAGSLLA